MKIHIFSLLTIFILLTACNDADLHESYISTTPGKGSFALLSDIQPALCLHPEDYEGVKIAFTNFKNDLEKVSGKQPGQVMEELPESGRIIIAGTLGQNPWIDELAEKGLIPGDELEGKWEKFIITAVQDPFPGIDEALVIAGSDKRGTIFGIYDLSEEMGVSPWYFWADVPVIQQERLFVKKGIYTEGEPKVKYRGIFINDEAPALSGWVHENYGSFNHEFYDHVFELILRLKGNYLWPAMWGRAFYDDDPENPVLADKMGVVIGTSHHEPLMRAHDEWRRYGEGPWNYEKNKENLQAFWAEGTERMGSNESIVTIGMRGDGDEPMTEGTAIALLEEIVKDQRVIIEEQSGVAVEKQPQAWALYKEVQDYYDKGMRVPEDVTLLLCDDNWGNIRKLPKKEDRDRQGGFGIYYHFDYVGGPRNYKWLNTNQIERTWEQMNLAWEYGADRIWIVNVGDIKPMELPISFFLDYAWDPEAMDETDLPDYYRQWAAQQFGAEEAEGIAEILAGYTKYNARRKPELLSPETYSLDSYREWDNVVEGYKHLEKNSLLIGEKLDEKYRDAYFQLVSFPVQACANLNELYYYTALNRMYAAQERNSTDLMARKVEELFQKDAELTRQYHEDLADGKWNHMMAQTHIGYTYWQEPPVNRMPETASYEPVKEAGMGIYAPGAVWDSLTGRIVLPEFDRYNQQVYEFELYNKGEEGFDFTVEQVEPWLSLLSSSERVNDNVQLMLSIDWSKLKEEQAVATIQISGAGKNEILEIRADNRKHLEHVGGPLHMEANANVSIFAENYAKAEGAGEVEWKTIPNLGRRASAVRAEPVDGISYEPGPGTPYLEYPVYFKSTGTMELSAVLAPTLNFHNSDGRRIALGIDDEEPVILNIHEGNKQWLWNRWVATGSIVASTKVEIDKPGVHLVKYYLVDPGLVLQEIQVDAGGIKPSYLGPPESFRLE